ncbi:MAG: N-acetylmuramoyl-L-alanine amidase [Ginsengibacter sp.]
MSACSQHYSPQPVIVRTTGIPYLKYGPGDDRLGGAKMTFLDSNILLKVVDSFKEDYIVQLSKNHTAYIPKTVTKPDTTYQKGYLTGDWEVYGDSAFDYVTIALDERIPYSSVQQIDPSRVVVDIYGAHSNTNWIAGLMSAREIKNAWYEQVEDDVMRVFIELNHPTHWGYSLYYNGHKLTLKLKRQPRMLDISHLTIAVDAGHGGDNMGTAGSTTRIKEKEYTLLFAKELEQELLKRKARVVMTREKDTSLTMEERIEMLKPQQPDLLVSLHLNSSSDPAVQGVSTYYRYIGFKPLTVVILQHMLELGLKEYGNIGSFNFGLSGITDYPTCLVEIAFLSNREDEKKISDPKFRRQVATKIADGIEHFLRNL